MNNKSPLSTLLIVLLLAGIALAFGHNVDLTANPNIWGAPDPSMLVIDTISEPESLDPAWIYDTASAEVAMNVYETLVFFDRDYQATGGYYQAGQTGEFVPVLAKSWMTQIINEISPQGLNWVERITFEIRLTNATGQPITFHNGDVLTTEDVEYSFERWMVQDRAGGPLWMIIIWLLGDYYSYDPVTEPDFGLMIDNAVQHNTTHVWMNMVLPAPDKTFLQIFSQSWAGIVDKAWVIANGGLDIASVTPIPPSTNPWSNWAYIWNYDGPDVDTAPDWHDPPVSQIEDIMMGTGPYELVVWDKGTSYAITKYDSYWDGWPARNPNGSWERLPSYITTVVWWLLPDFDLRRPRFLTGNSDMTYVDRQYRDQVLGQPGIRGWYGDGTPELGEPTPEPDVLQMLALDAFFFTFDINTAGGSNPYAPQWYPPGTFGNNGIPPDIFSDVNARKGFAYSFSSSPDSARLMHEWSYTFQQNVVRFWFGSSPAIADLGPSVNSVGGEPNSDLEIVTGSDESVNLYPELGFSANGIWRAFDSRGNLEWAKDTQADGSTSSPAIVDITADGLLDIAGGTSGLNVEAMDGTGNFIWTFPWPPQQNGPFMWHSSPAVADLNPYVGGLEVVIGNRADCSVWVFDGDNSDGINDGITATDPWIYGGTEGVDWDVLWKFNTDEGTVEASPAIGDVDGDSSLEIVVGSADDKVYVLDGATGILEHSFSTGGPVVSSAALANIDGDPYLEIVTGSNDKTIYAFQWDGSVGKTEWTYLTNGPVFSSPAIGDIDADGSLEIVVGSNDCWVYALSAAGSLEWRFPTAGAVYSSPALAARESVSVYDSDWPMFRHDAKRTGFCDEASSTGLGVYVGSDDNFLYLLNGTDGSEISSFLTLGAIQTSPSVADIDGDQRLEILFYDQGASTPPGGDTFWCIEDVPPPEPDWAEQPSDPVIRGLAYDNPMQAKHSYNRTKAQYYMKLAWGGVDSRSGVPGTPVLPEDPAFVTPGALWIGGMRFQIAYNSGNLARQKTAETLKANINSLNPSKFLLDPPISVPWGSQYLNDMVASKLPVFINGWTADYTDPDDFAFAFMHSLGTFSQLQGYSNPRVDALIEAGAQTPDDTLAYAGQLDMPDPRPFFNNPGGMPPDTRWPRRSIYYELQAIYALDDVPSVTLVSVLGRHWERDWIRGWYYNPLYGGSLTPGIDSTAPATSALYVYHLWKAKTHFGDANNDGFVDVGDLGVISAHWGGPPVGASGYAVCADLTGGRGATTGGQDGKVLGIPDGKVNIIDIALISAYYDGPPVGPLHP